MPAPNFGPTYGALFIGLLFSAVLFGVTMLQTFVYFQQYPSDRAWRKLAVSWLWFLDALHLALSAHFVYHYLVSNYANPAALSHIVWSFKFRVVIDLPTQVLAIDEHIAPFGKEARRWSRQKVTVHACASRWVMRKIAPWLVDTVRGVVRVRDFAGTLTARCSVDAAIAIAMCYETIKLETFDDLLHAPVRSPGSLSFHADPSIVWQWATYVPLGTSTVIDAMISGSLCYFLWRCRPQSETGNGPIKTLMVYTLNTGIITSFCSLITISMMVAYPMTFIPIAIEFLVIKLYINSYMAMLNARTVWQPSQAAPLTTRHSFLPSTSGSSLPRPRSSFRDHKGLPFPSVFPVTSDASLPLTTRTYAPAGGGGGGGGSLSTLAYAPAAVAAVYPLSARNKGEWERRGSVSEAGSGWDLVEVDAEADAPLPLRLPRLSHPDVCPQYGLVEAAPAPLVTVPSTVAPFALGVGFGGGGGQKRRANVALARVFAEPVDPLTPCPPPPPPPPSGEEDASLTTPLPPPRPPMSANPTMTTTTAFWGEPDPAAARSALGHDPEPEPEQPTPPERALSPLRFASYSSSCMRSSFSHSHAHAHRGSASQGGAGGGFSPRASASSPGAAQLEIPPRPGRPRLPSACSTAGSFVSASADFAAVADGAEGGGGVRRGSGQSGRFAMMVSAARESRRELYRVEGGAGAGAGAGARASGSGGEVGFVRVAGRRAEAAEKGTWVWGGPGAGASAG
ncbi:hypothetical protein ACG7TL_007812 [Trametes sanguinea]